MAIVMCIEWPWFGPRYYQVEQMCSLVVKDERLTCAVHSIRVGSLPISPGLANSEIDSFISELVHHGDLQSILASIEDLHVEGETLVFVGDTKNLHRSLLRLLRRDRGHKGPQTQVVQHYVDFLFREAKNGNPRENQLLSLLKSGFLEALNRSHQKNAVEENRALIVAAALLLGDRRLEALLESPPQLPPADEVHRLLWRARIRGRGDWTSHFFISAALSIIADRSASSRLGTLKEEIDSAGKSGFSFADLLADRAGDLFAIRATQSEESARWVQERVAGGITIDELFPPADDLPEGISDVMLENHYGGTKSHKFQSLERQIQLRLEECELLR